MVAPTRDERSTVLRRDDFVCVACGARIGLEMHHRRRVGEGGSKLRVPVFELLTACSWCNADFEARLQNEALVYGWKVKTWADPLRVPVFNRPRALWGFLLEGGGIQGVDCQVAHAAMRSVYGDVWVEWASWVQLPFGLVGVTP